MADIDIQKKKRKPQWPWFLLFLALVVITLGIIWFDSRDVDLNDEEIIYSEEDTALEAPKLPDTPAMPIAAPQIDNFYAFAHQDADVPEMGLSHEYTAQGLKSMAEAIGSLAEKLGTEDVNVQQKKQELNAYADRIQRDPKSLQHADIINAGMKAANDALMTIQENHFPGMEGQMQELKDIASNFNPDKLALNQKSEVKRYLELVSELIRAMANEDTGLPANQQ